MINTTIVCLFSLLISVSMTGGDRIEKFIQAWQNFTKDSHVSHAAYSMTVLDSRNSSILFEHNKDLGLPPASTMKTISAAAALHYLGENYTYQTFLQFSGDLDEGTGILDGFIYIVGTGDPSLGSSRYDQSITAESIMNKWIDAIRRAGIRKCRGIIGDPTLWGTKTSIITDGWTWNDVGHWYGTGHSPLNWRENEFRIEVQPGCAVNDSAIIQNIIHPPPRIDIINELITVESNGDASLYFSIDDSNRAFLRGTVGLDVPPNFYIKCAIPNSGLYIAHELTQYLRINGIEVEQEANTGSSRDMILTLLNIHQSPPLSSLLVQYLPVSINMYGEVLIRTIAHQTKLSSQSDAPTKILRTYIKTLFNDEEFLTAVALTDGSGLSRSNRLTTYCLAKVLFKIQSEPWFESFFNAFPIINGIPMKSGSFLNTVGYAGYLRENSFVFSFMINNYHGLTVQEMRIKAWQFLDTLK